MVDSHITHLTTLNTGAVSRYCKNGFFNYLHSEGSFSCADMEINKLVVS